jgi:hypothetical protein
VGNFFATHSYAFMYGTPNTHTGILFYWQPDDRIRIGSGVTNGWDNFSDGVPAATNPDYPGASSNLAYLGSLTLASENGGQLLTVAVSSGNEYTPVIDPAGSPTGALVGNRSMITAYWQTEFAERLTAVTEGYAAWQFNADTGLANRGQPGGLAQWYGVSQYLYRGLTDTLSAGVRLEWYRDNNGFRTAYPARNGATNTAPVADGFVGNLWGTTFGFNWTPTANWIVRPELRYDWYTPSAYGTGALPFGPISARSNGLVTGDAFSQWYIGCDAIYQF